MSGSKTALQQGAAFNSSIPLPLPLDLENKSHYRENFQTFKFAWTNYAIASGMCALSETDQISRFTIALGPAGQLLLLGKDFKESDRVSTETLLKALEKKLCGTVNMRYDRMQFNQSKQNTGEAYEDYFARLLVLVKRCRFGGAEEELLLDHILSSISDRGLRRRMSESKSLTLDRAMQWCKTTERYRNDKKKADACPPPPDPEPPVVVPKPVQQSAPSAPSWDDLADIKIPQTQVRYTHSVHAGQAPSGSNSFMPPNAYSPPSANYSHHPNVYPDIQNIGQNMHYAPAYTPHSLPPVTCQMCSKSGHVASDCPMLKKKPVPPVVCQRCSKIGHVESNCPKKDNCVVM